MNANASIRDSIPLENRPGIFIIGSPNVGKRTLLSRLLSVDFEDFSDSASEVNVHGWNISNKYYSADVSLWTANLRGNDCSDEKLSILQELEALVMVFDMSDLSPLTALQDWVSRTDIQNFEILLCIGNKVDLLPGHPVHAEYRRRLLKLDDSVVDPYAEVDGYGISESEVSSLLGDEELSGDIRKSCLEWCTENNIEFIEACASNADFDKCLSVDGDSQGVERLFGALSAHMWPGMILKSDNRTNESLLPVKEELSSEESDYELEYEVLSAGSAEPWDDTEQRWVSATSLDAGGSVPHDSLNKECENEDGIMPHKEFEPSTSSTAFQDESDEEVVADMDDLECENLDAGKFVDLEDLEQMMSEIGNMRASLRLMPDFQRREMAAKLAMKMASVFGGESDEEEKIGSI